MASPIGYVSNQLSGFASQSFSRQRKTFQMLRIFRKGFIYYSADQFDDIYVCPLVNATNIVALTQTAFFDHQIDAPRVVFHIQPVPSLLPISVDGQRLVPQDISDHQRDQFLREVIGSVVVGAVAGGNIQAVGVVVGADQVVGRGLAGRVGAVGSVGCGLAESGILGAQGTIDFVGGNVVETVVLFVQAFVQPDLLGRLEQAVGADDIGFDKGIRAADGSVHVAFSGEMHQGVYAMLLEQGFHQGGVTDVAVAEVEIRVFPYRFQVSLVAGIGEGVQYDNLVLWVGFHPVVDEVCAYEAGAAGYQ